MTIRQALRSWFRFLLVSFLMIGALAQSWADTSFGHALRLGILGLLFAAAFTLFHFGFRCPRCTGSLLRGATAILTGQPFKCPKCGTSVDERR